MKWFDLPSLRSHLLVLICLAPIPALGLVVYNAAMQYRAGVAEAQENALRATRLAAVSQKQLMGETQHLLDAWTKLPSIAQAVPAQCHAFLSGLLQGSSRYANFGLIARDGQLVCSGLPFKPPVDMAHRPFFQRAERTRAFVVGDYEVGFVSGRPSLYLAQPLIDEAGQLQAVLYAALDLSFVNKLLVDAMPRSNAVVVLFNSNGVILGQYPDSGKVVGKRFPDAPLVRAVQASKGEGVVEVAGLDGVRRLYAFTTLSKSSEQDVYLTVTIGVPTEEAFSRARHDLYRQAGVLGATVLLILIIIWIGADRLILRPLSGLLRATEAMRAGNLEARSGVAPRQDELGRLARTFDDMAEALEIREAERAASILEIQRLNEGLEQRVAERTSELRELNETLEQRVNDAVRKNIEQERMLVYQSRQAAMGEMIGNIAHQWRQPLNTLNILLANIKDANDLNELTREEMNQYFADGVALTKKMSDTIDDFRSFFRPAKEKVQFSLKRSLADTLSLLSATFKNHDIKILVECEKEVTAYGFPNEYSQVLMNLLNNAKDVIVERGIAKGEIRVRIARENGLAILSIRDNGGGISEEALPRVFEAYFTTKEQGTGVGLYMSKVIIENSMGGRMLASNVPGGAEFTVICAAGTGE